MLAHCSNAELDGLLKALKRNLEKANPYDLSCYQPIDTGVRPSGFRHRQTHLEPAEFDRCVYTLDAESRLEHLDEVARLSPDRGTIGAVHAEAQSGATVDGGRTSAAEAEAFIAWRDAALSHMFQQLAAVEASEIAPPSIEEFIGGITPIVWPNP
jgi:hypothetical protein